MGYTKINNHVEFIKNQCSTDETVAIKTEHGYADVVGKANRPTSVLEGDKKTGILIGTTHSNSKLVGIEITELTDTKSYINTPIIYKLNTDLVIDKKNKIRLAIIEAVKHTYMVHSINDVSPAVIIHKECENPRLDINYKKITYINAIESVNPELAETLRSMEPILNKDEFKEEIIKCAKNAKEYANFVHSERESNFKVANYENTASID